MPSTEPPVALITGTNRGSGRSMGQEFQRRGHRVYALNRTLAKDGQLNEIQCDLSSSGQIYASVDRILAETGRIDLCVSNAVCRVIRPITEFDEQTWEHQVAVNFSACFHLIRATLPAIRATRGTYVIMGSHAGNHFFEGGAAYSATKAALRALVETLLIEERRNGVRACLISPGAIANLDGDEAPFKMSPDSVARCVASMVESLPDDVTVGEVELRPAHPPAPPVTGISRLLHV